MPKVKHAPLRLTLSSNLSVPKYRRETADSLDPDAALQHARDGVLDWIGIRSSALAGNSTVTGYARLAADGTRHEAVVRVDLPEDLAVERGIYFVADMLNEIGVQDERGPRRGWQLLPGGESSPSVTLHSAR